MGAAQGVLDMLELEEANEEQAGLLGQYIGEALRIARDVEGLTQYQVAAAMSEFLVKPITQSYLSKIEQGHCEVTWRRFALCCEVLKWSPARIMELACLLPERRSATDQEMLKRLLRGTSPIL